MLEGGKFRIDGFLRKFLTVPHIDHLAHFRLRRRLGRAMKPQINKGASEREGCRDLTVVWKSKKALACRVNSPISLVVGAQFMSTSGNDFLPSLWWYSYDRTMNLGEFSGSSARYPRSARGNENSLGEAHLQPAPQ